MCVCVWVGVSVHLGRKECKKRETGKGKGREKPRRKNAERVRQAENKREDGKHRIKGKKNTKLQDFSLQERKGLQTTK